MGENENEGLPPIEEKEGLEPEWIQPIKNYLEQIQTKMGTMEEQIAQLSNKSEKGGSSTPTNKSGDGDAQKEVETKPETEVETETLNLTQKPPKEKTRKKGLKSPFRKKSRK